MMFDRGKCKILNLRRKNPMRTSQFWSSLSEKSLGVLVNTRLNINQQFTWLEEGKYYPPLQLAKEFPPGESGISSPLLSTGEATPGQLLGSLYIRDMDILESIHWGATRMIKGQEHLSYEESLRDLELFSVETWRLGIPEGQSQALLSDDEQQDQRQWTQTETQEVLSERCFCQKTLFHCEGGRALAQVAQVAQGGCGVSILGDIQELFGQNPGQQLPDGPDCVEVLEEMISREANHYISTSTIPTLTILWFSDSRKPSKQFHLSIESLHKQTEKWNLTALESMNLYFSTVLLFTQLLWRSQRISW